MQNRAINVVAAAAITTGFFAVGAAAVANDGTGNPQGRGGSVAAKAAEGITLGDGKRNINLKTRINSSPFTFTVISPRAQSSSSESTLPLSASFVSSATA